MKIQFVRYNYSKQGIACSMYGGGSLQCTLDYWPSGKKTVTMSLTLKNKFSECLISNILFWTGLNRSGRLQWHRAEKRHRADPCLTKLSRAEYFVEVSGSVIQRTEIGTGLESKLHSWSATLSSRYHTSAEKTVPVHNDLVQKYLWLRDGTIFVPESAERGRSH